MTKSSLLVFVAVQLIALTAALKCQSEDYEKGVHGAKYNKNLTTVDCTFAESQRNTLSNRSRTADLLCFYSKMSGIDSVFTKRGCIAIEKKSEVCKVFYLGSGSIHLCDTDNCNSKDTEEYNCPEDLGKIYNGASHQFNVFYVLISALILNFLIGKL